VTVTKTGQLHIHCDAGFALAFFKQVSSCAPEPVQISNFCGPMLPALQSALDSLTPSSGRGWKIWKGQQSSNKSLSREEALRAISTLCACLLAFGPGGSTQASNINPSLYLLFSNSSSVTVFWNKQQDLACLDYSSGQMQIAYLCLKNMLSSASGQCLLSSLMIKQDLYASSC